jgi:hypothetical protein
MSNNIEFTIAGRRLRLSRSQVISKLKNATPGRIQKHGVDVGGVIHPVKEAFSRVTGLDVLDFNTDLARRIFQRLGFGVSRTP